MANPVGFRFRPTNKEIISHYVRLKNLGSSNTSHGDEVINTVDFYSFDPWDLPSQSRIISRDRVWYFFSPKENKYTRGDRQNRKTKSGFWKKTGVTMDIMQNREKIGEKRVLVFHLSKALGRSKTDWVMHEYHATPSSPSQMMVTYTICKVEFKGEVSETSSSSSSSGGGLSTNPEGSSFHSQEFQNPSQFSGVLDVLEEAEIDDAIIPDDEEWKTWFADIDDDELKYIIMQDDRNDYRPQKSLVDVFIDRSSADDSDLTSSSTLLF